MGGSKRQHEVANGRENISLSSSNLLLCTGRLRRQEIGMQKTTEKQLAVRAKRLSKEGYHLLELMNVAEASVYRNVNLANYHAWHFGKFLASAKAELGHGRFTIWRGATFPNVQ